MCPTDHEPPTMPNQSPSPPNIDSPGPPNPTPTTPFNTVNPSVWSVPHPITSPAAGPIQIISPYSGHHPFVSSGSPVIFAYPGTQPITPASSTSPSVMESFVSASATPAVTTQLADQPKPRRTRKKKTNNSTNPSVPSKIKPTGTNTESSAEKSGRKQRSWEKDFNSDGKSMVDLIVEWLCFTWGDQEQPSDAEWMCMDSSDTISTNYARYRMGLPGKKECARRCALFIGANGFETPSWEGVKQKFDNLESKFKDAEGWRRKTGEGGGAMIKENVELEIAVLPSIGEWTEEAEDEIRTLAAETTKECLHSRCAYYDVLLPIMAERAGNEPMYTGETGVNSQPLASNISVSRLSEEPQESQSSAWDTTQTFDSLNHHLDESQTRLDIDQTLSEDLNRPTSGDSVSSRPIERTPSSQLQGTSKTLPRLNLIQPGKKMVSDNPRRPSAGTLGVLKAIHSSLPSQTDYEELKNESRAANESTRLMLEQASSTSNSVMGLLANRLGNPNPNDKHQMEAEDLTPEAVEKRKTKKAKTEELELLKLDRELAQERRALSDHTNGSGLSRLELAREKADMITKFCSVGLSLDEAKKMAEEILDGMK